MKKLFILTAIITTSLIASKGYSQVYVGARIGARVGFAHAAIGFPVVRRPFIAPAPVVYGGYVAPAPVYAGGYFAAPAVCETEFPGYAYYNYPAWNGHYRDRFYFDHYRPFFERDHRAYFNRGGFDHARFAHDRGFRGGRR